ncbi:hypothetical protein GVN16_02765 [Emticicia sp. CRIBPO]|uniref:hypothetical protein n=1 Tax=Emticicia sp. CRIBPO TaxID=2683258 RepID=UPI0014122787|nr:hypothetical protein [Emticicia sp. CRIBPO]NBA84662.1 hypothetical protein [Emticicia sp. CRIBPO]
MKHLFVLLALLTALKTCGDEDPAARNANGELCFVIKGDEITVINRTGKTAHYDLIDAEMLPRVNRIPFDCSNFEILESGNSRTYDLNKLLEDGRNPLVLTWWECKRDKISNMGHHTLVTTTDINYCTSIK